MRRGKAAVTWSHSSEHEHRWAKHIFLFRTPADVYNDATGGVLVSILAQIHSLLC